MLTQLRPLNSTTVTLDNHPNGIGVLLAGNLIGNIEIDPVWGLDGTQYDTAKALGLSDTDKAFAYANQVYATIELATASVIADHLASTATWEMPEYN
jgi:hypothetical protein